MPTPSRKILYTWLPYLAGIAVLLPYLYKRLLLCNSYTLDMGGVEQAQIVAIQRTFSHLSMYADPQAFPFLTFQHPPFYPWLIVLCCKLSGIDPLIQVHAVYGCGRILSLVANILSAALLFRVLRKLNTDTLISFLIAILSLFFLTRHNYALRTDSLKSLLLLVFVYLFMEGIRRQRFHPALYVLLAILPFFKQDTLPLILACSLYFAFNRDYRQLGSMILTGAVAGIIFTGIVLWCYGMNFFRNVIGTNMEFLGFYPFYYTAFTFLKKDILIILIYAAFILSNYSTIKRNKTLFFLFLLSVHYFIFSLLISFKFGSDLVYFTDLQYVLLIFSGLALQVFLSRIEDKLLKPLALVIIFTFTVVHQYAELRQIGIPLLYGNAQEEKYEAKYRQTQAFAGMVKKTVPQGAVLFPLDIDFVPFITGTNCMYGYFYIYHQFLYLSSNNYPLSYVVRTYNNGNHFHRMFLDKKVQYIILPDSYKGHVLWQLFYKDYRPILADGHFILLKVSPGIEENP